MEFSLKQLSLLLGSLSNIIPLLFNLLASLFSWVTMEQTNNTLVRILVHTYSKSLIYKIKVLQQLQIIFIHHYTSSIKLIKLNTANIDTNTILDQTLIMKQST